MGFRRHFDRWPFQIAEEALPPAIVARADRPFERWAFIEVPITDGKGPHGTIRPKWCLENVPPIAAGGDVGKLSVGSRAMAALLGLGPV